MTLLAVYDLSNVLPARRTLVIKCQIGKAIELAFKQWLVRAQKKSTAAAIAPQKYLLGEGENPPTSPGILNQHATLKSWIYDNFEETIFFAKYFHS